MWCFQQRFDRVGEPDDVGIVADELGFAFLLADLDHVYGTDGLGVVVNFVEERDDLFLVRDGHVEACQVGVAQQDVGQFVDGGDFKIDVFGIDVL